MTPLNTQNLSPSGILMMAEAKRQKAAASPDSIEGRIRWLLTSLLIAIGGIILILFALWIGWVQSYYAHLLAIYTSVLLILLALTSLVGIAVVSFTGYCKERVKRVELQGELIEITEERDSVLRQMMLQVGGDPQFSATIRSAYETYRNGTELGQAVMQEVFDRIQGVFASVRKIGLK